jgi:CheY-like chemotaxis protein
MDKPLALIIEDDRDVVALFRHVLDIAGYQTEIVLDGNEAMTRIAVLHPDIILLDLSLPGMSGVEILERVRADKNTAIIPVIVITANPKLADSLPVEPDLLLLKPVDIGQLSDLVQRLKVTQGAMREPVYDSVTGLYTLSFFKVRLTFSLERIEQPMLIRFGVLFADIVQLADLNQLLKDQELESLERRLAIQFKSTLRPTDTVAWSSDDGYFLTLIEEIPSPEILLKIAVRVRDSLQVDDQALASRLRINLGVLLCDSDYANVQQIMSDVTLARTLLRDGQYTSPAIFDRAMLRVRK